MANLSTKTEQKDYTGTKAWLIARVSDPSQRSALPAQELRLNEYARKLGLDSTLHSFDETAYKDDRRKFQEIVAEIAHYEEGLGVVVFDKIDRFTRDASSEVVRILKDRVKDGKLELHFPSDGLVFHKNSPACDKTRLGMGMVFGEYYSAAISDNVKRKIDQKLYDGEWPGKAPIGYLNITRPDGTKDIIPDPERKDFIKRIFELRNEGETFRSIAKIMKKEGLTANNASRKPVGKSQIEGILRNPFYYGEMRYNGRIYKHRYEPIISKMDFLNAQEVNKRQLENKNKKDVKHRYTFTGVAKCAVCGCSMSSYMAKGRVYMKCSQAKGHCPGTNVSEEHIEEQLNDILDRLVPDNATCERIYEELAKRRNNSQKYFVNSLEEVRQSIKKISQKEATLYEDRLCGRITVDTYDKIAKDLKDEKEHYEQQLLELTANDKSFELDAATLLWVAQHARELYKSLKVEQKTRFLHLLLSNLKIQQKTALPSLLEPFASLVDGSKTQSWLPDKLEFRTACYKYDQVYGRLLDEFVRENIDGSSTCLQVD